MPNNYLPASPLDTTQNTASATALRQEGIRLPIMKIGLDFTIA
jgi:hypothetical protein